MPAIRARPRPEHAPRAETKPKPPRPRPRFQLPVSTPPAPTCHLRAARFPRTAPRTPVYIHVAARPALPWLGRRSVSARIIVHLPYSEHHRRHLQLALRVCDLPGAACTTDDGGERRARIPSLRGARKEGRPRRRRKERKASSAMGGGARCELCGGAAAVHCAADSAFLCLRCDARVHGANFLASRHLRRRLDRSASASGASTASSGASCVSTADSAESTAAAPEAGAPGARRQPQRQRQRRRRGARADAEAVLEGWAKRAGVARGPARRRAAAAAAAALRAQGRGVAAARVPLRVAMAAALWAQVAPGGGGAGAEAALLLRRLEAAAHVPARLVLGVASWMARAAGAARPTEPADEDAQEGWAECS
ncbi:hypothetical protein BS78_04G056000 [Paspalum vaginatum]|nr:hypothetical protein BS78_04G056000 [Paspalum vaginatum]